MAHAGSVVLIHAFPLAAALWEPVRAHLPDGWRLVAPDLPGFGDSKDTPASSVDDMARSVLAVMDREGIDRAVIGGMSMGGYVTLALFRLAPDRFSGMVLVDTRATADSDAQKDGRRRMIETARSQGAAAVADEMLPKLLGETTHRERPDVAAAVRRMIERNRGETIAAAVQAMMDRPDSTPMLSTIHVPTLIVCGMEDALTPPADAEALRAGIVGSRLVLLPRAGHLSSYETPEAFGEELRRLLEGLVEQETV